MAEWQNADTHGCQKNSPLTVLSGGYSFLGCTNQSAKGKTMSGTMTSPEVIMPYWTIPLIPLGLLSFYWGVRMLLSEEYTRTLVQAKWNLKGRLHAKLFGLERTVVVARWSSPIIILVGVGWVVCGLCALLK